MDPIEGLTASADPVAEFDRLYTRVRRSLSEALSRSVTDTEQRRWLARIARIKSIQAGLDTHDLGEVLAAIALLNAELESTAGGIAVQLATADARSHQ